ncbi:hypothetical protein GGS24DRAFT_29791 [Hypoxylon argillaceum]|nr:hypothetical protein GGS24DRAFT_29791 [Hypoxylon argillaceum]KAI1156320.1 hypothetical protein F4825DRAFT_475484 [Nemania diffusa]
MTVGFKELEDAACNVIQIVKQIPELTASRLAVVGDLALWHYLPNHRATDEINFITDTPAPELLQEKLLQHPNSPFTTSKQELFYRSPEGRDIPIRFSPHCNFPYLPESALPVQEIPYGRVPYIDVEDLYKFKVKSSRSMATAPAKQREDKEDAEALMGRDQQYRLPDGHTIAAGHQLIRFKEEAEKQPVVILSPEQDIFMKEAPRGEDLTVSEVMPSPPLLN